MSSSENVSFADDSPSTRKIWISGRQLLDRTGLNKNLFDLYEGS